MDVNLFGIADKVKVFRKPVQSNKRKRRRRK